jgi:hypothetical protein
MLFFTNRYVYIDSCDCNLQFHVEEIIRSNGGHNNPVKNEDWLGLPVLSHGITAALDHLHVQGIDLNGQINPRTVLVKRRGANAVPQVVLPERWNAFNNLGSRYDITNMTTLDGRKRDLVALCVVLYFVQTCGKNFKGRLVLDYVQDIAQKTASFHAIEQTTHCPAGSNSSLFRTWKNGLAKVLICFILDNIQQIGTPQILKHPFFYDYWKMLNFFSAVSDFLKEGTPANTTKPALINLPVGKFTSMNRLLQSFPGTDDFIAFDLKSNTSNPRKIQGWLHLIKNIRNKVRDR